MQAFSILLILMVMLFSSCNPTKPKTSLLAAKGILDLRNWYTLRNNENKNVIKLDGEWEFYWKEFLYSKDFECSPKQTDCNSTKNTSKLNYIFVPHSWNKYKFYYNEKDYIDLVGDGYATYRLTILLPDQLIGEVLGIRSDYQGTAYRIYANSKLIQSAGTVSSDENLAQAMHLPSLGFIPITSNRLEIIIHISNFHNRLGGVWNPLQIGKSEDIVSIVHQRRGTDLFVIGVIFIILTYHLLIWAIRNKEVSPLYFSLVCIIVLIRLISTSEYLFAETFPQLGYKVHSLLEYCSMYFCVPMAIHYFTLNIQSKSNKYILYTSYSIAILFTVYAILTPVKVFSSTADYYQVILLMCILYILYILVYSLIKRVEYTYLSLFGFMTLAFGIVNDILYARELIYTGFLGPYALIVMIFSQAIKLSLNFSKAFNKVEELTETLELRVEERTKELNQSKEEVEALNNFTNVINSYSDLRQIFIEISNYVYNKYNIATVWLYLPDPKEQYLKAFKIYSHRKIPDSAYNHMENLQIPLNKDGGISYIVWKRKKPFYARFATKITFSMDKEIMGMTGSLSLLVVPLLMKQKAIGLMAFSNVGTIMHLNKKDIKKINIFCAQISGVVNTVNLLNQTEKQKKEIEELNNLIKSLNEDLNINVIMKKVHSYLKTNFDIQHFGLSSVSSDKQTLKIIDFSLPDFVTVDEIKQILSIETRIQDTKGAHAIAFKSKKALYSKIRPSILSKEELFLVQVIKAKNIFMLPLILQNEPIGFLNLYNVGELNLTKDDIIKLSILGEQLAGIIHGSNLFQELQEAKINADKARVQADIEKKIAMLAQKEAEAERQKSDKLLLNILPDLVAEELKEKGEVQPVYFESATILFTDFIGFTKIAEYMNPHELVKELDSCFSQFDMVIDNYNLEKLKTIGDSYMCAGGIPKENNSHAIDCCLAALEIQSIMDQMKVYKELQNTPYWELRIGIHTGPVMTGVVGEKKFAYDVWGDTVNIASRMESSGSAGKINISYATYEIVKDRFECEYRGKINAKNKGEIDMYYLNGIKPEFSKDGLGKIPNAQFFLV